MCIKRIRTSGETFTRKRIFILYNLKKLHSLMFRLQAVKRVSDIFFAHRVRVVPI